MPDDPQEQKEFAEQTLRMFSEKPKPPPLWARVLGYAIGWWWTKGDK